LILLREEMT